MINFNFNEQKATELVLYLANRINDASKKKILKLLFFADVYHINKYGRPILGNVYNALKQGPVNSKLYDLIKNSTKDFSVIGSYGIVSNRAEDLGYFSKSDIEALDYSIKNYGIYTADELSELSHEHSAWKKAWSHRGMSNNPQIDWLDFLDEENANDEEFKKELENKAEVLAF